MFFKRKLYSSLKDHLSTPEVTVLTGMRRTGKTTLIKQLLSEISSENKVYFDFENIADREFFSQKNYENIPFALSGRGLDMKIKLYIAIDEIQLVPNSPSVIKYLHDHYDIKFLVTGSSSYYLKNLFSESLAGRKKIFELFPLDFGEFLVFKGIPHSSRDFSESAFLFSEFERLQIFYEEFIRFGGFPEIVLALDDARKKDLLIDILSSYINIDIATLADFRRKDIVYSLMQMLASRVGSRLDYAKLARNIGVSPVTVKNYVDFFEQTYFLSRVPVFSRSPDKAIVKAKKLYFSDNGILNILAEVSGGSQFENAVFTELRHYGEVRYYALKNGREIDFIVGRNMAFEVKETPAENDLKSLHALAEKIGIKKYRLIGRRASPTWKDFIWGGDIG
ncbi:MAG: ATP-binding protein [Parcubacteria group bacterium]|nr:ATP-binding protein [Parcubacteria group bacterium]